MKRKLWKVRWFLWKADHQEWLLGMLMIIVGSFYKYVFQLFDCTAGILHLARVGTWITIALGIAVLILALVIEYLKGADGCRLDGFARLYFIFWSRGQTWQKVRALDEDSVKISWSFSPVYGWRNAVQTHYGEFDFISDEDVAHYWPNKYAFSLAERPSDEDAFERLRRHLMT